MAEIKLTRSVRRKLAKAAREEAFEIAERGAPATLEADLWCFCGIGHVIRRARVASFGPTLNQSRAASHLADRIDSLLPDPSSDFGLGLVSIATMREARERNGALVFPLLALADVLEETEGE